MSGLLEILFLTRSPLGFRKGVEKANLLQLGTSDLGRYFNTFSGIFAADLMIFFKLKYSENPSFMNVYYPRYAHKIIPYIKNI